VILLSVLPPDPDLNQSSNPQRCLQNAIHFHFHPLGNDHTDNSQL
jgi:hypothetical protein